MSELRGHEQLTQLVFCKRAHPAQHSHVASCLSAQPPSLQIIITAMASDVTAAQSRLPTATLLHDISHDEPMFGPCTVSPFRLPGRYGAAQCSAVHTGLLAALLLHGHLCLLLRLEIPPKAP